MTIDILRLRSGERHYESCISAIRYLLFTIFVFASTALPAQIQPRITQQIDDSTTVRVANSTHPLATSQNDRGRVDMSTKMDRIMLVFKQSDEQKAALAKLIDSQHDPKSPQYHRWLSPADFGTKFGPSQSDMDSVKGWLEGHGFKSITVARGGQWLEFSGTAGQVEETFRTEIHNFDVKGVQHIANATDIALPQALTPVVNGVLSLHNFESRPMHTAKLHVHRDSKSGEMVPDFTSSSGSSHYLAPGDLSKIYNTVGLLKQGIDGTGLSIAIVGRTDINLADVQIFRNAFSLPANDPDLIVNGIDPGINADEIEAALDVEWSGALAPRAKIKLVSSSSTLATDGVALSMSYIVDNALAPIMSTSYGECEVALGTAGNAFQSLVNQQAAAEGITAFVSSGDNGAAGCDPTNGVSPARYGAYVNGLASTAFNTAVGGTEFAENNLTSYWKPINDPDLSSAIGYIPEKIWNESCDPTIDPNGCDQFHSYFMYAGSGGKSSCTYSVVRNSQVTCLGGYSKPAWQAGVGVPSDGVRDVPDVSLTAAGGHDGYLLCVEGSCQTSMNQGHIVLTQAQVVGGTSASAPAMAGIMALVEQQNGAYQGLANYRFYQLAAAPSLTKCNSSNMTDPSVASKCAFHDVTQGDNSVPGQIGYAAATGYDLASGLGSVDAAILVYRWGSAKKLSSTTVLSPWSGPVQHGQPIDFSLTVSPTTGQGTPSGSFSLMTADHHAVFGGTLVQGKYRGATWSLPAGTYNIVAHYAGDATFQPSDSAPVAVQITPEPATILLIGYEKTLAHTIAPLPPQVNYGQPVGLQINVSGKSGFGYPSGEVAIYDNGIHLGNFPLNESGSAFVEVDYLGHKGLLPGAHALTASYSGDLSFGSAKSAAVKVRVEKVMAAGIFMDVPYTPIEGQDTKLFAAIQGPGVEQPTGTIQFYSDGRKISSLIPLQLNGLQGSGLPQASYHAKFPKGTHKVGFSYSGDSNYPPFAVDDFNSGYQFIAVQPLQGAKPIVHLTQSTSSVLPGQPVTYTVHVTPGKAGPMPTGTVNLILLPDPDNLPTPAQPTPLPPPLSPVTLVNGTATFTVPLYHAPIELVSAAYSGDATYSVDNSNVVLTNVGTVAPKVVLSADVGTVSASAPTTLSVSIPDQRNNPYTWFADGPIQFYDSLNGSSFHPFGFAQSTIKGNGGTLILAYQVTLAPGKHVIRAQYLGSRDWSAVSSNPVTIVSK